MKKGAWLFLVLLLLPLAVTFGQGAGSTLLITLPDAANNPLCAGAVTADCIESVVIFAEGIAQPVATIPASSFAISGGQATASIAVPAVAGRRYGNLQFYGRTNAVAYDGSAIPSLDGATVSIVRRPPPPVLGAN